MKTKIFLASLAIFSGAAVFASPAIVKSTLPKAYLAQRQTIEYTEYVTAIGEVVSADSVDIKADMPMIVDTVYYSSGDKVNNGDMLIKIDREQTARSMMELNEYSSIASLGAGTTITDYASILELIPEAVYSEYNGVVSSVNVKNGSLINANGTILTLSGTQPLSIESYISENKIAKINIGQSVEIESNAFGGQTYKGHIESIANAATKEYNGTSQETVVAVKIVFDSFDESIVKSGFTTSLKICVSDTREIEVIPYESVYTNEAGDYVYIFDNGCAKKRQITTGVEVPEGIEIISGIKSTDMIIYSDNEVKNGDFVAVEISS